jgi:hypothetical protein
MTFATGVAMGFLASIWFFAWLEHPSETTTWEYCRAFTTLLDHYCRAVLLNVRRCVRLTIRLGTQGRSRPKEHGGGRDKWLPIALLALLVTAAYPPP